MIAQGRGRRLGAVGSGADSFAMFLRFPGVDSRRFVAEGQPGQSALLSLGYVL